MKRLLIKGMLVWLALFIAEPAFAEEANHDSNVVTGFYGKYEYPKEDLKKAPRKAGKLQDSNDPAHDRTANSQSEAAAENLANLPSYSGKGAIIPATGDTSTQGTMLIGLALLALVFFKVREGANAEQKTII